MSQKRLLFFLAGVVLAGLGLASQAKDSHSAHSQAVAIVAADQIGTNVQPSSSTAIAGLQDFVKTHMGSSVSFSLTGSYNRALAASQTAAAAQTSNSNVYAAAQAACSGKTDSLTQARCNQAYLQQHLQSQPTTPVAEPKMADYQYSLKSPSWTPDLAGALILGSLLAMVVFLILLLKPRGRSSI
jgi:predicted membrane protein